MSGADYGMPESVRCPFCEGDDTELHAPFGSALSVATYWCRSCRSAFDWVKWDEPGVSRSQRRGESPEGGRR